jgi:membrane-associated protease RseP (regulator of RpoE activity)
LSVSVRGWFSFRRGETEYGIKAIPLGGYVKILGMNNLDAGVAPEDESRTFRQRSYPARVFMASAGTMMHLILAFVLFMAMFSGTGQLQPPTETGAAHVVVSPASPAEAGGMKSGDLITGLNGKKISSWAELRNVVQRSADKAIAVEVLRSGRLVGLSVTPKAAGDRVLMGVAQKPVSERFSVLTSARKSASAIVTLMPQTFVSLKQFFSPSHLKDYGKTLASEPKTVEAQDKANSTRMLSPFGATTLLRDAARFNFGTFLEIFASINVFVGIFNMLPILPLDGGHVLIATYERLRSRPKRGIRYRVDVKHWLPVTYVVMAVMLTLSLSSIYLDLRSPIKIF